MLLPCQGAELAFNTFGISCTVVSERETIFTGLSSLLVDGFSLKRDREES